MIGALILLLATVETGGSQELVVRSVRSLEMSILAIQHLLADGKGGANLS